MKPKKKVFVRPKIEYPPVPTRKWVPPDQRPKKKPKPAYVKPPGINQPLKLSSLGKVWHNFRVLDDRTFLLGGLSETHKRFRPKSNGLQTPCNCTIAIAFSKLYEMAKWSTPIVNQILELGDQLYLTSLQHLEEKCITTLHLSQVYASFFLGNNKITMCLKGKTYHGILFEDFDDTPYLANVIKDFFNDKHISGIITIEKKHFAFWLAGKSYYLFDPTPHDDQAYPWKGLPSGGYAMVMRFKDTDALVEIVQENVSNAVNWKFVITPCAIVRMVTLNTVPPENVIIPHCGYPELEEVKKVPKKPPAKPAIAEVPEEQPEVIIAVMDIDEEEGFNAEEEIEEYSPEVGKPPSRTPSQYEEAGEEMPEVFTRKEVPKSMIPQETAKAESITYFANIIPKKIGILRASTFQGDTRFSNLKGKQSLGNAMAALTMLRIHKSRVWFRKILDQVLSLAEIIYKDSVKALPSNENLKVTTMCKKIVYEDREFTPDVEDFTIVGRLQSQKDDILDLYPALQEFFRDNDSCIISGPLVLALWEEDGWYYMYDPNERDHNGLMIIKTLQVGSDLQVLEYSPGVACVTWYTNLKDLAEIYLNNVEKAYRRDQFILNKVQIKDYTKIPDPWHNFQGEVID